MDDDVDNMDRVALVAEVKRLRAGIREHRDSSGHDLCWHHPKLWSLAAPSFLSRNSSREMSTHYPNGCYVAADLARRY